MCIDTHKRSVPNTPRAALEVLCVSLASGTLLVLVQVSLRTCSVTTEKLVREFSLKLLKLNAFLKIMQWVILTSAVYNSINNISWLMCSITKVGQCR